MNINEFMFIWATSLQVSGALVLLLHFVSTKRKNIIYGFIGKGFISFDNFENKLDYKHNDLVNYYKAIYLNKFAFGYILLGYIFNFWAVNMSQWYYFIIFIILIALEIYTAYYLSDWLTKGNKIKEITKEELNSLGINPHIESLSKEDVDIKFSDTQGKINVTEVTNA